jgi:hypothetical protein
VESSFGIALSAAVIFFLIPSASWNVILVKVEINFVKVQMSLGAKSGQQ